MTKTELMNKARRASEWNETLRVIPVSDVEEYLSQALPICVVEIPQVQTLETMTAIKKLIQEALENGSIRLR